MVINHLLNGMILQAGIQKWLPQVKIEPNPPTMHIHPHFDRRRKTRLFPRLDTLRLKVTTGTCWIDARRRKGYVKCIERLRYEKTGRIVKLLEIYLKKES